MASTVNNPLPITNPAEAMEGQSKFLQASMENKAGQSWRGGLAIR